MKKSLLVLLVLLVGTFISLICLADQYVRGYTRDNGTYVQPYHRTTPDSNPYNNYNTKGNTNPYTGQRGYENPYNSYQKPSRNYDDYGYQRKKLYDSNYNNNSDND